MNQGKWIKFLISEITTLPKELYKNIEEELEQSSFWQEPHTSDDIKGNKSPFTIKIKQALDTAFTNSNINVISKILALKESEPSEIKDSSAFIAGASYGVGKEGVGVVEIMLYPFPDEEFIFDYGVFIDSLSEVIRHELIHAGQGERRAKRKNISLYKASKEIGKDKRSVPKAHQLDPQYQEIYFSRKNEIEAYAHQTAEYLIKTYGKEKALEIISLPYDHPDIPKDIKSIQMWVPLKNRPKALKRLKNRIYAYIQLLTEKPG